MTIETQNPKIFIDELDKTPQEDDDSSEVSSISTVSSVDISAIDDLEIIIPDYSNRSNLKYSSR